MIELNASLLLINAALWVIMYIVCRPIYVNLRNEEEQISNIRIFLFFALFLIYSVYAFCEHDTYATWFDFLIKHDYSYYEPVYRWLATCTNENYFLWRFCIWSVAVISLYHLAKRLHNLTWEFLTTTILLLPTSYFIATRGTAGHALMLWAAMWLIPDIFTYKRNIFLGISGIVASYFLHRSMSINIALAVIALAPFKFNKKMFIGSLIAFPFLVGIVNGLLTDLISGTLQISYDEDMGIEERALSFADGTEEEAFNLNGQLGMIILRGPMYLMILYCLYLTFIKKIKLEAPYQYMFKLAYLCIYVGLLFAFQNSSQWLYQRITFMSLFPLVFVFSRFMSLDYNRGKFLKFVLNFSIFAVIWYFSYRYYKWS